MFTFRYEIKNVNRARAEIDSSLFAASVHYELQCVAAESQCYFSWVLGIHLFILVCLYMRQQVGSIHTAREIHTYCEWSCLYAIVSCQTFAKKDLTFQFMTEQNIVWQ